MSSLCTPERPAATRRCPDAPRIGRVMPPSGLRYSSSSQPPSSPSRPTGSVGYVSGWDCPPSPRSGGWSQPDTPVRAWRPTGRATAPPASPDFACYVAEHPQSSASVNFDQ